MEDVQRRTLSKVASRYLDDSSSSDNTDSRIEKLGSQPTSSHVTSESEYSNPTHKELTKKEKIQQL